MLYGNKTFTSWDKQQTNLAIKLFKEEKSFEEIADHLNAFIQEIYTDSKKNIIRSPKAIAHKLQKLGYISETQLENFQEKKARKIEVKREFNRKDTKEKILKRDNYKCVLCDSKKDLQFCHIVPFRKTFDNIEKEAITLCEKDHELFDQNSEYETKKIFETMKKYYPNYDDEYKIISEFNPFTNRDKCEITRK